MASRLLQVMVGLMIMTNFSYVVVRTDLRNYVPFLFGTSFGLIFLFGPLIYFYARAVIDPSFQWQKKYGLHFIPYGLQLLINIPLLIMEKRYWLEFINSFLSGTAVIRSIEIFIFAVQDIHLLIYLVLTYMLIRSVNNRQGNGNVQYLIPVSLRLNWLKNLLYSFALFLITVFGLYIFILIRGTYHPVTNYVYTLITSGIIYFIAYRMVLSPEILSPDFAQKYKAYMPFSGEEGDVYMQKIKSLMLDAKLYTDPELKLSALAEQIGLPSHQASKLINEKFGKSFNELINEYRVEEFIRRVNHDDFKAYSIYGIALEVGFNSKSSFNTAFKKITGKTPSSFKT
ncbi:MAG: AraC family transcriptional regulator [Saprospiraceae bacterium]|uniref:AraC family transcriptional regulator n=1 Tax=Candidatus Opimibacter skivensis TaxID=2982028 RepID=A0A9D7SZL3_9BACT|nr:AraC family transcriptional regulator [Candidatus Opimibacter skivensis]